MKLCWFIKYVIENNKKDNNWTLYFILTCLPIVHVIQEENKWMNIWGLLAKLL